MTDSWNLAQLSLNPPVRGMKGSGNKLTLFEIGVKTGLFHILILQFNALQG